MVLKKYVNIKSIYALFCASIVVGSVLIDFITKKLVMITMNEGESIPLIKGVLNLTYITNDGAAFGSFADHRWVFMSLSSIMIVALIVILLIWDKPHITFYVGISLALGGGIGNMIDRIAYGTVVDFIDFCAFPKIWRWIFNGADSFVCVGAGLLILYYITDFAATSVKTQKAAADVAAVEHGMSTLGEGVDESVNASAEENSESSDTAPEAVEDVDVSAEADTSDGDAQ